MSGTKVTTDPESQRNPINEGTGTVLSDSLAGESIKSGGDFGSTTNAAVSGQSAAGTTTNNTDISGATVLDGAADAEARQAKETWSETAALNAGRELRSTGSAQTHDAAGGLPDVSGLQKPKGENLKEGGFDADAPNASFNQAVGTKKDPARVALEQMTRQSATQGADIGQKDAGVSGDGQYDILKDASA